MTEDTNLALALVKAELANIRTTLSDGFQNMERVIDLKLKPIVDDVGRLEKELADHKDKVGKQLESHETRLDELEKSKHQITGIIGVAGIILGGAVSWFLGLFQNSPHH